MGLHWNVRNSVNGDIVTMMSHLQLFGDLVNSCLCCTRLFDLVLDSSDRRHIAQENREIPHKRIMKTLLMFFDLERRSYCSLKAKLCVAVAFVEGIFAEVLRSCELKGDVSCVGIKNGKWFSVSLATCRGYTQLPVEERCFLCRK